jgi:hypothetical protein
VTREPDLRELVGDDLPREEEARLQRVHELLVAAGPPPELPPALERAPIPGTEREARVIGLPARHRGRVLTLAAGLAAAMLLVGYVFGVRHGGGFNTDFSVNMSATPAAPSAAGTIDVGPIQDGGNWPLRVRVNGLPQQPKGAYYELFLTRRGKALASCGTFRVHTGTTEVRLNAPYDFRHYDGWIVTAHVPGRHQSAPLLRVGRA